MQDFDLEPGENFCDDFDMITDEMFETPAKENTSTKFWDRPQEETDFNFERNKKSDKQKTGLLIGQGLTLVRVKQCGNLSEVRKRKYLSELLETIEQIKSGKISREVTIGDING